MPCLDRLRRPLVPALDLLSRVPRNTSDAAPGHIAAHYDLGNGLFELFLDDTMRYSCAIFEEPELTLREAQEAKLDRVCRKLNWGRRTTCSRSAPAGARSRCRPPSAMAAA
jgi:mycolic acid cyclopropane synthetase